ncbi:hypothetical protein C7820_4890 [Paenibacillus sp. VMFN-D1]|nr:hypothetical protein C7820_4890 [Paenibacillus sp. VMFN-D1]
MPSAHSIEQRRFIEFGDRDFDRVGTVQNGGGLARSDYALITDNHTYWHE